MSSDSQNSSTSDDDKNRTVSWSESQSDEPTSSNGAGDDVTPGIDPMSSVPATYGTGRYKVDRPLGRGGFGYVYAGYDSQLRRRVAIKVARPDRTPQSSEEFFREARHLAQLNHESILRVYDVGLENGECFIVTDLIDGLNLYQWMQQNPPTIEQSVEIVSQVADALAHAHSERIVHRDVKPGNILIDRNGKPVLADFGLALTEEEVAFGPDRSILGTFAYLSPEQARGEGHRIDGCTDIYSLGVVLYELLCGRRPFDAPSRSELLRQVCEDEPQPPRQLLRNIPVEVERICLKAMAKRAKDRYSTAADFADELRRSVALEPVATGESGSTVAVLDDGNLMQDSSAPIRIVPKGARSFGRDDHDFFLELLPGPRDRNGFPESVRFWKSRIESSEPSFRVGVLYGPSGSGKSSLVRAGLLPHLKPNSRSIWLESTLSDTELRLKQTLVSCFPEISSTLPLNQMIAMIRGNRDGAGQKTLVVIDQFEQWLHENGRDLEQAELVAALRQADGQSIQFLLLVRDDFWLGVTRLFDQLELKLDPDFNISCVDLFDLKHARRVLGAFGHAYGRLPERRNDLTPDHHDSLTRRSANSARTDSSYPCASAFFRSS